jgi:hypothetical protein
VLPDLAFHVTQYLETPSPDSALEFMRNTGLGESRRARGVKEIIKKAIGNSRHLWLWDYSSIERELNQVGFVRVRRALFGDSIDARFNQVEHQGRWTNCLGVECRRG